MLLHTIAAETASAPPRAAATRRWRVAAVGAAAATAGALGWVFLGPGGDTPAAAWAAVPTAVPSAAAARLASGCENRVAQHRWPISRGQLDAVLAERRGASSAVLLVGTSGHDAVCVNPGGSGTGNSGELAGPLVGVSIEDPARAGLTVDSTPGGPGLGLWAVYGRVASPQAVKVLVTLSDGREVTATLAHGHYLAWWPATAGAASVRAVDSAGNTVASTPLDLTGAGPVPKQSR